METSSIKRLDGLDKAEIDKLYKRSIYLPQIGLLFIFVGIFFLFLCTSKAWLIAGFYLATSYVFRIVRTTAARIYFYLFSIGLMLFGILNIVLAVIEPSTQRFILSGAIALLSIGIGIAVFRAAKTDVLFGNKHFSHAQIAAARKKRNNNEDFVDEDLPPHKLSPFLASSAVVLVYTYSCIAIIGFIAGILLAVFSSTPKS
jgi:hypothetical protein